MTEKKEEQLKEQIAYILSKKDYYQILGVSRTATQAEIKKSYRNLALKFHPDKNQLPGSKDVFKKVSNAYTILIDVSKRQNYDRFGAQEDQPRPQYRYNNNNQQDFQFQHFDDIFKAFFGANMHQMNGQNGGVYFSSHTFNFGGPRGNRNNIQQERGGSKFYYFFILFFLIYSIVPLFDSGPSYSFQQSKDHNIQMATSTLKTPFWVNKKYFEQIKNQKFKLQSQMQVDKQRIKDLQKKCQFKKKQKSKLQQAAYKQSPGLKRNNLINQAKNIDLSYCRNLSELSSQHEQYIRDLLQK